MTIERNIWKRKQQQYSFKNTSSYGGRLWGLFSCSSVLSCRCHSDFGLFLNGVHTVVGFPGWAWLSSAGILRPSDQIFSGAALSGCTLGSLVSKDHCPNATRCRVCVWPAKQCTCVRAFPRAGGNPECTRLQTP